MGYEVDSGDYKELAETIKRLDLNDLKELGINSKEIYFKKYSKRLFIDRLIKESANFFK